MPFSCGRVNFEVWMSKVWVLIGRQNMFFSHVWTGSCKRRYDQLTPAKTGYPPTSITWPYRGLKLRAHRDQLFFFNLTADQVLVSIDLQAQRRLTHLKINEASFFARFLWLNAATRPHYVNNSSYTVNACRVQVENGLENVFLLHFLLVSIQFGPHWWLRSYPSQALEVYKLKAECLFLICLELLFSLYCNFWHIFRISDQVAWCLEELWLEQKRKERERERQRQNRIPVIALTWWKKLLHKFFPWALNRLLFFRMRLKWMRTYKKWFNRVFLCSGMKPEFSFWTGIK